jgi:hypothetical protein
MTSPTTCKHERVDWQPLESEHGPLGLAVAWHSGRCLDCHKSVTVTYDFEMADPVVDEDENALDD